MELLREIKALHNMRMNNSNTGDVSQFITATGDALYLDVYELIVSCVGRTALKRKFIWEYNPDVVDVWDAMKYQVSFTDRESFHFAFGFLRRLVSRLLRDSKRHGIIEACRRWVGLDVRFLLKVSNRKCLPGSVYGRELIWR